MHYRIRIRTAATRVALEDRLPSLTAGGPFHVQELAHEGSGVWTFTLQPIRPGMMIGFGKVAELLVLLAREFDVDAVERSTMATLAAAS